MGTSIALGRAMCGITQGKVVSGGALFHIKSFGGCGA